MKQVYRFLFFAVVLLLMSPGVLAAEWSYDWPKSATADKPDFAGGYYNFGTAYDAELTAMTRTFNGKVWTLLFDKGTKLTYLAGSGQAVGSPGAYTSQFTLASSAFSGKIKRIVVAARTKVANAMLGIKVNGKDYACGGIAQISYTNEATTPDEYEFLPGEDGAQEGEIVLNFTIPGAEKNAYVKKILVEYEDVVSSIAMPTFSPAGGQFDAPVTVTMTAGADATILYTTDGSSPRAENNAAVKAYASPVEISETTDLKAVARVGEEYSAVAEAHYVVRKSPGLSIYGKSEFSIELLEEDVILVDNPNKVKPLKYSSSNPQVAWADEYGHIYTYSVGETVITVKYAGDEIYLPQELQVPVTVVAKTPLSGLTVSPGEGVYTDVVEVTVVCDDPKAKALWYHVGDKPMELDDLGVLQEFEIHPSTSMTLKIDRSCVLSVQAMGENVWSEARFVNYTVNLPLKADFKAGDSYTAIYSNGFDTEEDLRAWEASPGSSWQLTEGGGGYRDLPSFSTINPESKKSLYHAYANTGDVSVIVSPAVTVPKGGKVEFYAAFNPVWIFDGNLILYVMEDNAGAEPAQIWNALLASQEAATDDVKWTPYSVDLKAYEGKTVYFSFVYSLNQGDDVLIDDFAVVAPKEDVSTVSVPVGEALTFTDCSTGEPTSWEWRFSGGTPETSTERHPTVTYSQAGTYSVTLTVHKGGEESTVTRENYVVVHNVAPTAKIGTPAGVYYSPEAGLVVPLNTPLTFNDMSDGFPTAYFWELPGTDLKTTDQPTATVKYEEEGMYDVDLTVSNDAGKSSTYLHGVKAGGNSLAWNISAEENANLGVIQLGWYGNYGGSNWLGMEAFAESFEAPVAPVTISSVNVYFGSVVTVTPGAEISVSVALADAEGLPGSVVATSSLPVSRLVDASDTYNDPTVFVLDKPVKMSERFFVTISGFPNNSGEDGEDNIAMFALRRSPDERSTTFHLLQEQDEAGRPTGVSKWYAQQEERCSFAIAANLTFDDPESGVESLDSGNDEGPVYYYNLQGIRIEEDNLVPGIYIRRQGTDVRVVRL